MKKIIYSIIIAIVVSLCISSFSFVSAKDSTDKKMDGFVKVEGNYALKDDGSLWKVNLFYSDENQKIADGFIDIDTDNYRYAFTALKADGSLWAWKGNEGGQFGEADLPASDALVKIMENVKEVSGLLVLKNDGSVWAWSDYKSDGDASRENAPVLIYKGAKSITSSPICAVVDDKGVLYRIEDISTSYEEIQNKRIKISDNVEYVKGDLFIKKDKTLWQIDQTFEEPIKYKARLVLKNVKYADSDECSKCAIQEDGTLWVWGFGDDNIPDIIKGYDVYPQKIMSNVKYASCSIQSVTVVKNDGSLCGLGAVSPKTEYSVPRVIMKNTKKVFENGWVLTTDNTLWRLNFYLGETKRIKIADNVRTVTEDGIVEKNDNTKWVYIDVGVNDYVLQPIEDSIVKANSNSNIDDNISKLDFSNHFTCYIKSDSSLWMSLNGNSPIYAPEKVQALSKPLKLMDEIKEVKCVDPYIFAISKAGELLVWRINMMESTPVSTEPKKIMVDVEAFDNELPVPLGVIKKDKSRWSGFLIDEFVQPEDVNENYAKIMVDNLVMDFDNIEDILIYNENMYVKKNGELWIKSHYDSSGISVYDKVMDKVKYAEVYNYGEIREGIAICNDGSLWHISVKEPKKVLEKVKEAHYDPTFDFYAALQEDNSFYVWGHNEFGECGIDSPATSIEEPNKLFGDVSWFEIGYADIKALKKDGTLMRWGLGFPIAYCVPYVKNPLSSGNFDKDTKIQHRNFETVGVNEKFNLIVKINDSTDIKDVKVVFSNGDELLMDKSTEGYYVGTVSEFEKAGVISYRINAFDSADKVITSEEYKVEVLKNDIVLFDNTNGEVFVSDSQIFIAGEELYTDTKPVIKDGRTLVPVRALCEAINADVQWDDRSKTVNISMRNKTVSMKIGDKEILVNDTKQSIDVPAIIVSGRTMLPLRTVGEIMGAEVGWKEKEKRIDVLLN